jgi:4'-phosphopantetheinyl transferase
MSIDDWKPLSTRDVGLWWLTLDDVPADAWDRWTTLIDEAERARAAGFVHDRDRHQFIAAHTLLRVLLQRFAGQPAGTWRFVTGSHGKPSLHPDHGLGQLAFNISHTRGAVACAMALGHTIGVDIEDVGRSERTLEIAETYFAPAELALLRAAPAAAQPALFIRLWTLKEAYIKAHGDGLSLPLDQFAFSLSPLGITFTAAIRDDPVAWQFCTLAPTSTHMLSLAIRLSDANPVAVAPRRVTHADIDRLMTVGTAHLAS